MDRLTILDSGIDTRIWFTNNRIDYMTDKITVTLELTRDEYRFIADHLAAGLMEAAAEGWSDKELPQKAWDTALFLMAV